MPGGPTCPWATTDLPGIDGHLGEDFEDFVVDELPAYAPAGTGDHWFVRVRKHGLSTAKLRATLAAAAGVSPRDIGVAGRKDQRAVTTQWVSLPVEPVDPDDPRIQLLEQERHPRKLRMGHLSGNRFRIRLCGVHPDADSRLGPLRSVLEAGVPNYFGPQRFGHGGATLRAAEALLAGRRVRDPRLVASALQSAAFNLWLGRRVTTGRLHCAVDGDVLKKRATGGLFVCDDATIDTARVAAGEVDPTGPMFGPKMFAPRAESPAAEIEAEVRAAAGLDETASAQLGRFAPGTRRRARLIPQRMTLVLDADDLIASFELPAGAYATVLLGELSHAATDLRNIGVRPRG